MEIFSNGQWLPLVFAGLMGLSMLIYAVLDGYDLGVGILMKLAADDEKDLMIASIGPFWDANETWLVLGVGLLLVAFPAAHGVILSNLYLPVALMLAGLILRGVAFDFRAKAKVEYKQRWNDVFNVGSFTAAMAQGYMLGSYILGFEKTLAAFVFSLTVGFCLTAGYSLIGACWLIMKSEGKLQLKAILWARHALLGTTIGIAIISLATPAVSPEIFARWFSFPNIVLLAPVPLITGGLIVALEFLLRRLPRKGDRLCWAPFAATVAIFALCFDGLAYSFYPYIVPGQLKIVEAASAPESLLIILYGALVVLPALLLYTFFSYKIFHGKTRELTYN